MRVRKNIDYLLESDFSVSMPIDDLIETLKEKKHQFPEWNLYLQTSGSYDYSEIELRGTREENDEEFERRIDDEQKIIEKRQKANYARLKKIVEKSSKDAIIKAYKEKFGELLNLRDEILAWIESYIPDEEEALGVTNQIMHEVRKYYRYKFAWGLFLGFISALILIQWLR